MLGLLIAAPGPVMALLLARVACLVYVGEWNWWEKDAQNRGGKWTKVVLNVEARPLLSSFGRSHRVGQ